MRYFIERLTTDSNFREGAMYGVLFLGLTSAVAIVTAVSLVLISLELR